MGGAVIAAHRFTGIGNPFPFGPPHYLPQELCKNYKILCP